VTAVLEVVINPDSHFGREIALHVIN